MARYAREPTGKEGSAPKELRHDTHSSRLYFPEPADDMVDTPSGNAGNAPVGSAGTKAVGPGNASAPSYGETLQIQKVQHQIEMLEKELNDPSSMRDWDGMCEELTLTKRELRSLKPWWGRCW